MSMLTDPIWIIGADLARWLVIGLFALFAGGALRVLYFYRQKNKRFKGKTGKSRPMFTHVVRVAIGAVLAAVSAVTNNIEKLGEPASLYIPLNLLAFYFLWTAMLSMMNEATHKAGWLRPEHEEDEARQFADEVRGQVISDDEAAKVLLKVKEDIRQKEK